MTAVESIEKENFLAPKISTSFDSQESDISNNMARVSMNDQPDCRSGDFDEKKENFQNDDDVFYDCVRDDVHESSESSTNSEQSEGEDTCEKNPLHAVDTWNHLTKKDKVLPAEDLAHVMDYSMAMLGERLCEANREHRERLKDFDKIARFRHSEIVLGKRVASGSFADIFLVKAFQDDNDSPACAGDQATLAKMVKQHKPDEYVVKVLRKSLLVNKKLFATGAADFITEGTLLASFDHPHIVSIRGRSTQGVEGFATGKRDCIFLLLERVNGDLTHKLRQWKERTSGLFAKARRSHHLSIMIERLSLMSDLASALAYLHERHVIHRDVALGNVGISFDSGKAKLLDFGLAKVLPQSRNENERFLLTGKTGSVRYMAPEIGLQQPYNLRADVYSFTILLYEVMTLEKAYQNWQSHEIYERVHHNLQRPRMHLFWSQRLKELFRCCWSHNPDDRLPMNYVQAVLQKEIAELQTTMELGSPRNRRSPKSSP